MGRRGPIPVSPWMFIAIHRAKKAYADSESMIWPASLTSRLPTQMPPIIGVSTKNSYDEEVSAEEVKRFQNLYQDETSLHPPGVLHVQDGGGRFTDRREYSNIYHC